MSRVKQGFRVELDPDRAAARPAGQHAGLSRVVENFCLAAGQGSPRPARRRAHLRRRQTSSLTPVPWSAPALEKAWRAAHPTVYPWFAEAGLSSRVPKEACRVRAAGLKNWADSRKGARRGRRVGFPTWRKRKHGSRFRYDADRARPHRPARRRAARYRPGATREDMSWLTGRIADGRARIIGATVREQAGRWWVSFQLDIDRTDVDTRRAVRADAPTCGIDLGTQDVRGHRRRHRRRGGGPRAARR